MSRTLKLSIVITSIVLIFIAGLLYGFRENIVRFTLNPRTPYQTYSLPPQPDYAQEHAWHAKPGMPSQAHFIPQGIVAITAMPHADVFYVHPTTFYDSSGWNAPIEAEKAARRVQEIALSNQASPFNLAGRIFAPRYRQATLYAMLAHGEDARAARQTAYGDVARAFAHYINRDAGDRPFLLVGYGQGGLHAIRLLQDYIVGKDLQARMIAAYVIDYALPLDLFDVALNTLAPCQSKTDVGCVISWNAQRHDKDPDDIHTGSLVWNLFGDLTATAGRELLCINPISWAYNQLPAPNPGNLGGVAFSRDGDDTRPVKEITGAECRDGQLLVDEPHDDRFRRFEWPGARYRLAPYNAFYMNLRENATQRTAAWFAINKSGSADRGGQSE